MQSLILLSVLLATFAIPTAVVRAQSACRYQAVLRPLVAFVAVYVWLLLFVYPRLF